MTGAVRRRKRIRAVNWDRKPLCLIKRKWLNIGYCDFLDY